MEFDYGILFSLLLSWLLVAIVAGVIIYLIVRLAVSQGLRAHEKRLSAVPSQPSDQT